ncbi:hypothetical protein AB0952_36705 [Streptomyces caniferus]|uniref:hypothetical protein n=1 Tax=Streptomyces caniferus TaxID=285557 RepID=UPI003451E6F4
MVPADQVVLAERAVDCEGVARDVGSQRAVGAVALGGRSAVLQHGRLHRRREQRFDPADRPEGASGLVGSHRQAKKVRPASSPPAWALWVVTGVITHLG